MSTQGLSGAHISLPIHGSDGLVFSTDGDTSRFGSKISSMNENFVSQS